MNVKLIALIAGAGALAAGYAMAEHHEGGDYDWEAKVEEKFAKVDANGDGQITRDEFLAYKAAKAEKAWDKHAEGAGDDGEVSLEEAKAMHQAKMEMHKEKMKDGDQ